MNLMSSDNPILRQVAEPVNACASVRYSAKNMRLLMRELDGLGLSAPQVGISLRFFVSRIKGIPLAINPVIAGVSPEKVSKLEGCLTWPGRTRFKKRYSSIMAEWTNRSGKVSMRQLHGLDARIFQHELDHLDGIVLF